MNKKFYITIILLTFFLTQEGESYHNFFFRRAEDITSGILPNARLDASSVTLQGNIYFLSNFSDRITTLEGSTSTRLRLNYNIVIGSLTALNVDIASNTADGLREAVRILTGLPNSTTGYGSILYRTGTYNFNGATVPHGVSVYATDKSSVVWRLADVSSQIVVCYGNIDGIRFSFNAATSSWVSAGIEASSGCKITNASIVEVGTQPALVGASIFRTNLSTDVHVSAEFLDYKIGNVSDGETTPAAIEIVNSKNVTYTVKMSSPILSTSAGVTFMVSGSSDVYIQDGYFGGVTGRFIYFAPGNRRTYIRRNTINLVGSHNSSAYIGWLDLATTVSSITVVTDNIIIYRFSNSPSNFDTFLVTGGSARASGLVIANNYITADIGASPTLFTLTNTVTARAILLNNIVQDAMGSVFTFISDSGASTQFVANDNMFNGVEQ